MLSLREREIREILDEDQKYNRVRFENEKKNAAINNITYSPPKKFEKAVAFEMNKYFIKIQAAIDKAINNSTEQNFIDIVEAYRLTIEYIDAYANKRGLVQRDISKIEDKFDSISNSINHVVDLCRGRNFIFTLKKLENIKNNIDQRIYSYTDIRTTPRDFLSTGAPAPISTTLSRPVSTASLSRPVSTASSDSASYFDVDKWSRNIPPVSRSLSGWDGTESSSVSGWDGAESSVSGLLGRDAPERRLLDWDGTESSSVSGWDGTESSVSGLLGWDGTESVSGSTNSNTSRLTPSTTSSRVSFPPSPEFPPKLREGVKPYSEVSQYSGEQFENYLNNTGFSKFEKDTLRFFYMRDGGRIRIEAQIQQELNEAKERALKEQNQKEAKRIYEEAKESARVDVQRLIEEAVRIAEEKKAQAQAQAQAQSIPEEDLTTVELFNKRKEEKARQEQAQEELTEKVISLIALVSVTV